MAFITQKIGEKENELRENMELNMGTGIGCYSLFNYKKCNFYRRRGK